MIILNEGNTHRRILERNDPFVACHSNSNSHHANSGAIPYELTPTKPELRLNTNPFVASRGLQNASICAMRVSDIRLAMELTDVAEGLDTGKKNLFCHGVPSDDG